MFWAVLSGQAPRHTQNTSDFTDAPYLCWHQSQISRMSRKVLKHFSTLLFPAVGQDPKQKEQLSMGFHLKSWPGYRWVVGYGGNQNENPKIISRVFKSIWRNYSLVIHKFYGQKGLVIIPSDFLQDRQLKLHFTSGSSALVALAHVNEVEFKTFRDRNNPPACGCLQCYPVVPLQSLGIMWSI